jgi:hypothetical protein
VPPDRGTIIGRAIWKPRYVVVGAAQREPQSPAIPNARPQISRNSTPLALRKAYPEGVFLSVYKSKDDAEPVQQHAIATIQDCQVQMIAHRKQGPVLPTLIINIVPDPATDKLRKRRSSRTAGLTATKETAPTTLFFRPGQESHALHDWAQVIHQFIQSHVPDRTPLSPITPASPTFINPFSPRPRDASESLHRPGSENPGNRPAFFSKGSNHTGSSRERPVTYSETHSLRSKPSDLSSHTSSMSPSHMVFHHSNYMSMHPTDLPSPATTIGDYQGEFIEGWTSAQGRSSTISSPVRTRDSIGSQIPPQPQPLIQSSSPPIPRETILDRAFQLRYIPGSERELPGEEKLSSLARFDALMREADEKRKEREQRDAHEARARAATMTPLTTPSTTDDSGLKSAWDLDDDSDDDDDDFDEEDDDEVDPVGGMEQLDLQDRFPEPPNKRIPPSAQLALEYIAGRHEAAQRPQPSPRSPPLSYNHDALMALSNSGSSSRPQTGYSKNRRPAVAQRTHSQPQLAGLMMASSTTPQSGPPTPAAVARRDASAPTSARPVDEAPATAASAAPPTHRTAEKRLSTSSIKRQSFTEFTKRLSSTSSLLLFPSGGSNRGSNSELSDVQQQQQQQYLHHLHPRAAPQPPQQPQSPPPDKCGWRGSVGVFGAEGGFL